MSLPALAQSSLFLQILTTRSVKMSSLLETGRDFFYSFLTPLPDALDLSVGGDVLPHVRAAGLLSMGLIWVWGVLLGVFFFFFMWGCFRPHLS